MPHTDSRFRFLDAMIPSLRLPAHVPSAHTGSGRTVKKVWGQGAVTLDYTNINALDRFGRARHLNLFHNATALYLAEYGYDNNGNRTSAIIAQEGHVNDRSFLYRYDPLNRLVHAEHGKVITDASGEKVFDADTNNSSLPVPRAQT